jgi:hypothetical protein
VTGVTLPAGSAICAAPRAAAGPPARAAREGGGLGVDHVDVGVDLDLDVNLNMNITLDLNALEPWMLGPGGSR